MPTLEPPGTIGIIGAGPLGLEAALYGRFLGYQVSVFEADTVASSYVGREHEAIPMSPDRCMSPLARSALVAQAGTTEPVASPTMVGEWIHSVWRLLPQTDLLRGRLHEGCVIKRIELVEVVDDETGDAMPPDFRLTTAEGKQEDFEAVIQATGQNALPIEISFAEPQDYYFRIGTESHGDDSELEFWKGLKTIVALYARLGGRAELDLYRPIRG